MANRVFPALLKYWRGRSGLSQLDLALAANVSSRHLSYLETGRAQPSESMVLRLMAALNVPLRHRNDALIAAGFAVHFPEAALEALADAVQSAISRMLQQQEPFPMTVLAADYRILQYNAAAQRVFGQFMAEPRLLAAQPLDMFALILDPALGKPFVREWSKVARHMLMRLQREVSRTGDVRLASLLDRAMRYPEVESSWRYPDDNAETYSTLEVWLQRGDLTLGFMTTLTAFSAPGNVLLDELRLESYFPLNAETRVACERLASDQSIQPLAPARDARSGPLA
ncbi:helix-turn-helix transcriptional regulator [Bradyrhizobium sediminis]|uniref:Helix-turn-helix transcriptional regulator n=1 Tax=Bradyrhizobium sediminis TaxID=2840469 RepID=A0A975NWQ5_9BRAD|nr:helix-turn-helix transcriptional regulator [Bradyrhizobium sediminis]QWG21984.1 helix-turn-helix transcriptional regulator [Bradyrhizobium sediminis]